MPSTDCQGKQSLVDASPLDQIFDLPPIKLPPPPPSPRMSKWLHPEEAKVAHRQRSNLPVTGRLQWSKQALEPFTCSTSRAINRGGQWFQPLLSGTLNEEFSKHYKSPHIWLRLHICPGKTDNLWLWELWWLYHLQPLLLSYFDTRASTINYDCTFTEVRATFFDWTSKAWTGSRNALTAVRRTRVCKMSQQEKENTIGKGWRCNRCKRSENQIQVQSLQQTRSQGRGLLKKNTLVRIVRVVT